MLRPLNLLLVWSLVPTRHVERGDCANRHRGPSGLETSNEASMLQSSGETPQARRHGDPGRVSWISPHQRWDAWAELASVKPSASWRGQDLAVFKEARLEAGLLWRHGASPPLRFALGRPAGSRTRSLDPHSSSALPSPHGASSPAAPSGSARGTEDLGEQARRALSIASQGLSSGTLGARAGCRGTAAPCRMVATVISKLGKEALNGTPATSRSGESAVLRLVRPQDRSGPACAVPGGAGTKASGVGR